MPAPKFEVFMLLTRLTDNTVLYQVRSSEVYSVPRSSTTSLWCDLIYSKVSEERQGTRYMKRTQFWEIQKLEQLREVNGTCLKRSGRQGFNIWRSDV